MVFTTAAIVATSYAVAKIVWVAGFDVDAALAITQAGGAPNVALSAILASLPAFAAFAILLVLPSQFNSPRELWHPRDNQKGPLIILVVAAVVLVLTGTMGLLTGTFVAVLVLAFIVWPRNRAGQTQGRAEQIPTTDSSEGPRLSGKRVWVRRVVLAVALAGIVWNAMPAPSLPAEQLTCEPDVPAGAHTCGPTSPVAAYVLSDGEFMHLLSTGDRTVFLIPTKDVSSRAICQIRKAKGPITAMLGDWVDLTLVKLVAGHLSRIPRSPVDKPPKEPPDCPS